VNAAIILGVGLFALGGVSSIAPLREAERGAVKRLALRLDPVDSVFNGDGSPDEPWRRWKSKPSAEPAIPRILAVDDDPEAWFGSSPPSPVDCAVMFKRLYDAGHRSIGIGYLMTWEEADPLAMVALRQKLDLFDAAVLGLPLARGAAGEPVPAAFLRLSMDAGDVEGDSTSLPQVNRIAVLNSELGGERSLAGFTLLENERDAKDGRHHLLARWNDRILFALPLAAEIAALGIDPAEIRVVPGKEIRLGIGGPVIPIDEFGRTTILREVKSQDIPATKIISEDNPVPPAADPLLLRDVRENLSEAERAWSDSLASVAYAMRAAPRYEKPVTLPRAGFLAELGLIAVLAFFGSWATCLRRFGWRLLAVVLVAGFGAELLYLLAARQNIWLPPFCVAAIWLASLVLSCLPENAPKPVPEAAITWDEEPVLELGPGGWDIVPAARRPAPEVTVPEVVEVPVEVSVAVSEEPILSGPAPPEPGMTRVSVAAWLKMREQERQQELSAAPAAEWEASSEPQWREELTPVGEPDTVYEDPVPEPPSVPVESVLETAQAEAEGVAEVDGIPSASFFDEPVASTAIPEPPPLEAAELPSDPEWPGDSAAPVVEEANAPEASDFPELTQAEPIEPEPEPGSAEPVPIGPKAEAEPAPEPGGGALNPPPKPRGKSPRKKSTPKKATKKPPAKKATRKPPGKKGGK